MNERLKIYLYAFCIVSLLLIVGGTGFLLGVKHEKTVQRLDTDFLKKRNELLQNENQKYREDIYLLKMQAERVNDFEEKLKDIFGLSSVKNADKDNSGLGGPEETSKDNVIYNFSFYDKGAENLYDTLLDREKVFSDITNFFDKRKFYRSYPPFVYSFLPVPGRIRSRYGTRIDPITGKISFHKGVDLSSPYWTPVRAIADGKVLFAGYDYSGYGRKVIIDHGMGFESLYAHNVKIAVKKGDIVEKGETIAYVGSSGRTTGPHLHFELRYNNRTVNPLLYYYKNRG
ncbi:MAG: M23 family metallopeptidase [Candidatus Schekmanbacteria bacterium]|nr:MAG: M23 family metallopeptidase [Candidatus Schekmanbacteria bacterium]